MTVILEHVSIQNYLLPLWSNAVSNLKKKKELKYNKWWTHREYRYKTQLFDYILSTQVFS